MSKSKILLMLLLTLLLGLFQSMVVTAQDSTARVRVAHFSPDTPNVDVYVNGDAVIQGLAFNGITGWIQLPAGSYSIAVAPAGTSLADAAIGPANFSLGGGSWTTIAATGSLVQGTLGADLISESYSILQPDEAYVTIFHGIEDAPAVDVILADGTVLVSNLAFGQSTSLTVPQGVYNLQVVPTGAKEPVVINLSGTQLFAQTYYFVAATNTLASPSVALSALSFNSVSNILGVGSITDIAVSDSRFSTLVAALTAADMAGALNGGGPYTVFAPTNDAFAALGSDTLNAVLADKSLLQNILKYHIAGGVFYAEDVVSFGTLLMTNGESAQVTVENGKVYIDGAQILITDIQANNGVIHVIGSVMLP
jgi:uncharacterized surface protein with fasciclin (FAS1) repeats